MTDKSFGDPPNRNSVKNPLLSSSVVGLSIEDLTNRTVLLPVSQYSEPPKLNPDIKSTIPQPPAPIQTAAGDAHANRQINTQTQDDFNVEEYFARLQCTRYVSAPINQHLDQNVKLPSEENLEEINLNESDEPAQSITADLAQNFSQLPTVLPQMASVVFNSFSSMLNYKSREQTPAKDEAVFKEVGGAGKIYGDLGSVAQNPQDLKSVAQNYQELGSVGPMLEVEKAPPPKDPPLGYSSNNFRITTKKKAYAQLPGLTTGQTNLMQPSLPPPMNMPTYFTPTQTNEVAQMPLPQSDHQHTTNIPFESNETQNQTPNTYFPEAPPISTRPSIPPDNYSGYEQPVGPGGISNFSNQGSLDQHQNKSNENTQETNAPAQASVETNKPYFMQTQNVEMKADSAFSNSLNSSAQIPETSSHSMSMQSCFASSETNSTLFDMPPPSLSIMNPTENVIPPPTMFSNPQNIASKASPLPPSVARKLAANQPTLKPQISVPVFNANIFTPAPINTEEKVADENKTVPPESMVNSTNIAPVETYSIGKSDTKSEPQSASFPTELNSNSSINNIPELPQFNAADFLKHQEPPKPPVVEPPKMTSNVNFRMTKRRPQYYSGPIEGVGSISNNVKPVIPTGEQSSFQGNLFTPVIPEKTDIAPDPLPSYIPNQTENYLSQTVPIQNTPAIQSDSNQYVNFNEQFEHSTAFDFSRSESDTSYTQEKQETNVFGLIGSLKSKLSSIDINKIQSTVTTFFDPEYNVDKQSDATSKSQSIGGNESNIELFIQNTNASQDLNQQYQYNYAQQTYYPQYDNPQDQSQSSYSYPGGHFSPNNQVSPQTQYVDSNQQYSNFGTNQTSFPTIVYDNFDITSKSSYVPTTTAPAMPPMRTLSFENNTSVSSTAGIPSNQVFENQTIREKIAEDERKQELSLENQIQDNVMGSFNALSLGNESVPLSMKSDNYFDTTSPSMSLFTEENATTVSKTDTKDFKNEIYSIETTQQLITDENKNMTSRNMTFDTDDINNAFDDLLNPDVDISKSTLFGLSNMLAEHASFEQGTARESKNNNILAEDNSLTNSESPEQLDIKKDIDICETCREVAKPEEKSIDLTSQLIENITAPIQLSNPVEVPLKEDNTDDDGIIFDPNQCAEITHITEETIETIQVQSATELLDDKDIEKFDRNFPHSSYGWNIHAQNPNNVAFEHNYNFQPDPDATGFFSNNSLFFDEFTKNLIDESKDEIVSPSAPILEQEIETGPDVQLIEEDAKEGFEISDQEVIKSTNRDDKKGEKTKSQSIASEISQESFASRIDVFQKCDHSLSDTENIAYHIPTSISPALTIASYFDTGNYAAESHYRNSLTSPTTTANSFNLITPPENLSIPSLIPPAHHDSQMYNDPVNNKQTLYFSTGAKLSDVENNDKVLQSPIYSKIDDSQKDTDKPKIVETVKEEMNTISNVSTDIAKSAASGIEISKPPLFFGFEKLSKTEQSSESINEYSKKVDVVQKPETNAEAGINGSKPTSILNTQPDLPDPMNFFSTKEDISTPESSANTSKLASYFMSPPKNDNTKHFFELSQGQDHLRINPQQTNPNIFHSQHPPTVPKNLANVDSSNNNLSNLMKDLTSVSNYTPTNDQLIKRVNYFTIEYDTYSSTGADGNSPQAKPTDNINPENESSERNDSHENSLTNDNQSQVYSVVIETPPFDKQKCINTDVDSENKTGAMSNKNVKEVSIKLDNEQANLGHGGEEKLTINEHDTLVTPEYVPVQHHWFYRVDMEGMSIWRSFSAVDNQALENAYKSADLTEETMVATDGGRYDVNVVGRVRIAVYWAEKPTNVWRCSWFYKDNVGARYVPYSESIAEKLEEEYRLGTITGDWHRRLVLPNNEVIIINGPQTIVHFNQSDTADAWSGGSQSTTRPRVVRRSFDENEMEENEPSSVDHLLLLCHGVGSACDMRFRPVEKVVDDFRATSLQLIQAHYKNSYQNGDVGRIEVLPISWHGPLHTGARGVDAKLALITLHSIPKLRSFTNDTVLDVLFYTSPVYCQTIIDTVCTELNRIYALFKKRNPNFTGSVSLGGHSLGSVILYDLLSHQGPEEPNMSSKKKYVRGKSHVEANHIKYPTLDFSPSALYALGSPIAIFECIRGVELLGEDFCLPTCKRFFNIFHPYDPVAYRIEPLINESLTAVSPVLIPHHKGRKRLHLELKEAVARVSADLKQKFKESIRATWASVWRTPPQPPAFDETLEDQMTKEPLQTDTKEEPTAEPDAKCLGKLNGGNRIDYVLQEAPFEMINEYLFAMRSHVGYWESEDTMLMILKEVYDSIGIKPDTTVPQQKMTVERTRTLAEQELESSRYPSDGGPSTSSSL